MGKFKYQVLQKGLDGEEDIVLSEFSNRNEFPNELEMLGFKNCKTKLDENGTLIYYKGKRNQVYVRYINRQ